MLPKRVQLVSWILYQSFLSRTTPSIITIFFSSLPYPCNFNSVNVFNTLILWTFSRYLSAFWCSCWYNITIMYLVSCTQLITWYNEHNRALGQYNHPHLSFRLSSKILIFFGRTSILPPKFNHAILCLLLMFYMSCVFAESL